MPRRLFRWSNDRRSLYAGARSQIAFHGPGEIVIRTEQQIEAAAAAAAEKANGGKLADPLFYKPEHRAFWKEAIRTAIDAADAASVPGAVTDPAVSAKEVEEFSGHCVYMWRAYGEIAMSPNAG